MSTQSLLRYFVLLRKELVTDKPSDDWKALRNAAVVLLSSYRGQLTYLKMRADYAKRHNEEPEESTLLTERDLRNLKEAAALNREIGRRLSELKKSKTGAPTARAKATKSPARRPRSTPARKGGRAGPA